MTIGELRALIAGLPDDTPIVMAKHYRVGGYDLMIEDIIGFEAYDVNSPNGPDYLEVTPGGFPISNE